MARCAARRQADPVWLGIAGLGAAYTVALLGNVDATDAWAAAYGALLLLTAELAHAAAGAPDLGVADAATRGRYWRAVAVALLGGFGAAELLLAAASSGGRAGAEATALGMPCAAAALALLAVTARRATAP